MKLSEWAKEKGISYRTAYRMFKANRLPIPSEQLKTGTILVYPEAQKQKRCALYARVSSHDQKNDLERQMQRLRDYSANKGLLVVEEKLEIGSGLNGKRKKLLSLLSDETISVIVVEHCDRLVRFGFSYIEAGLKACGREIVVLNETEENNDLVQDFIDVVTSMCSRIYGKRSARNKALRAWKATNED